VIPYVRRGINWLRLGRFTGDGGLTTARRIGPQWRDLNLALDISGPFSAGGVARVQIGGDTFSRFTLDLDGTKELARLQWSFTPQDGSGEVANRQQATEFLPPPVQMPYQVSLGVKEGSFAATLTEPAWLRFGNGRRVRWSSLTPMGDWLALTIDERLYVISPDGQPDLRATMDGLVSEVRAWQFDGQSVPILAVCVPSEDRVLLGSVIRPARLELALGQGELGPHLSDGSSLQYPLSAAGSPDGRSYVLDAGHSRIVVFGADGNYITQWGTHGSDAGQFDFGDGLGSTSGRNFAGSIAVDDDGFIYVADVGNRRIQKFAP
jgi:hypothetical protein